MAYRVTPHARGDTPVPAPHRLLEPLMDEAREHQRCARATRGALFDARRAPRAPRQARRQADHAPRPPT